MEVFIGHLRGWSPAEKSQQRYGVQRHCSVVNESHRNSDTKQRKLPRAELYSRCWSNKDKPKRWRDYSITSTQRMPFLS